MTLRRSLLVAALPGSAFALAFACSAVSPAPHILITRVPQGTRAAREDGDTLRLKHADLDDQQGISRGFSIVRSEVEWRQLWPNLDSDRIPLLPHGTDFSTGVLFVAVPDDETATAIKVKQVIDTPENGIHLYVARELTGEGCKAKAEKDPAIPVDVVEMPRIEHKEFHVHLETLLEDPCAAPPEPKIACRMNGTTGEMSTHLVVEPGKGVACLSEGKPGVRPTIDRTWSFRTLPLGTAAKMTIGPDGSGMSFNTDAFGTYSISLQVSDDLGRNGEATTDVDVLPPKDVLAVQMLWTKFDPKDDIAAFPRVELHVNGERPPPAAEIAKYGKFAARATPWILVHGDCTVDNDKPPSWCKTMVVGSTAVEELALDQFPEFRIGVHYVDDRFDGQPVLCVRAFRGNVTGEWCDNHVRPAGNWWDVARLDAQTGKPPVPPAPPAAASASAAPAGSAKVPPPASSAKPSNGVPVPAPSSSTSTPTSTSKAPPSISVTNTKP